MKGNIVGGDGLQNNLCASDIWTSFLFMANICCSIDMEPRTLNQGQLNHAREVAADVVQKMEPKEASTIFTKESGPVVPIKEMEKMEEKGDQIDKFVECNKKAQLIERPCQCSCDTNNVESPDHISLMEPLSAPF